MSNKLHVIKCLNCIHVRKLANSEPCLGCYHVNIRPWRYDLFHRKDKFIQRQGLSVMTTNGDMKW